MTTADDLDPIFVSAKEAARLLGLETPQTVYALLDQQIIESQYLGRRRLVSLASLREYAASLPRTRPEAS